MKAVRLAILCSFAGGLAGCVHHPKESDYTACELHAQPLVAGPAERSCTTASQPEKTGDTVSSAKQSTLNALLDKVVECKSEPNRPFDVLSLSGGGADGAYGAGFLHALIKKQLKEGEPFNPCLVTGVSTGAVMGSYVYLATSQDAEIRDFYLEKLHDLYLKLDDDNLVSKHGLAGLMFSPALYNVDGIRDLAALIADERLLADVAAEYRKTKRTFLVGATDLHAGNFDVIDLTDYAARNRPSDSQARACYREAVLASAAIPVAFPPVPIKDKCGGTETKKFYSDGGVRHLMFLNAELAKKLAKKKPMNIYGVINNTMVVPHVPEGMSFPDIAKRNAEIAGNQMAANAASLLDNYGALNGTGRFWATAENAPCPENLKNGKLFHPPYQKCLLEHGQLQAEKDEPWKSLPKRPLDCGPIIIEQ